MKKEVKNNQINDDFAENGADAPVFDDRAAKKTQKAEVMRENSGAIDKKFVQGILKEEKKQLKQARKTEKEQKKLREKNKRAKLKQLYKVKRQEEKDEKKQRDQVLKEAYKKGKLASWFRLDNAACIYPSAVESEWNFVFRISAQMKEKVDSRLLQEALDDILPRFPSFNVRIRHGFFWNYYEKNFEHLKVEREKNFPCEPFNLSDSESFLLRVLYSDYNIILEVFHAITDGRGALLFLNSLVARYIELKGQPISNFVGALNYLDLPDPEEYEDSFQTAYTTEEFKRPKEKKAYKVRGNLLPPRTVNTIEAEMQVEDIKKAASKYDAKLTAYLVAVVAYAIYKKRKNTKRPVRISVPIDLRPWYGSQTTRNFSSYINVEVDGVGLEFKDVVEICKKSLSQINKELLQANINANVGLQKNPFIKILPLAIKNPIMKACFNYMGENYQTLSLSNIGKVEAPKEFEKFVEGYCINLGRSMHNEKSIGVVSYNGKLNICISSKLYEAETERDIITFLSGEGIPVKVYSNRRDLYATR